MSASLTSDRNKYRGEFPSFSRPLVVGFFSVDEHGRYFSSTRNANYLQWSRHVSRRQTLDLTTGEDVAVRRTDENELSYYRYLADHPVLVHNFSATSLNSAGFICNRQVLRKIANMPYQERDDELFAAYLFQGNIYLYYVKCDAHNPPQQPPDERWDRCSRWGYKFEQYMLSPRPGLEPISNVPVKEGEEFGCVFESQLNGHRLLFAAEMDGVFIDVGERQPPLPDTNVHPESYIVEDLRKRKFVELKTSSFTETNISFRKVKSRDIWLQSYFSGVETVVIGIRNYHGIVNQIKKFNTWDMLEVGEAFWSPEICLNFCESFLTFVKQCFANELSRIPNWTPDSDIKSLPPMELFFERNIFSDLKLSRKPCNVPRPYFYKWFVDGVAQNVCY